MSNGVSIELYQVFKNVRFRDSDHTYSCLPSGDKLKSVTTLLGEYKRPFDNPYWTKTKGDEWGLPAKVVDSYWNYLNYHGITRGSYLHNFMEMLVNRKEIEPEYPQKVLRFPTHRLARFNVEINLLKDQAKRFVDDTKDYLIPIQSELVVGDTQLGLGGMVDQLFFNVKANEYQLWDWKTDKKIRMNSDYYLTDALFYLEDCEFIKYSLQVSLYKYIIEKNTSLKLGTSYVVWFNAYNDSYRIIELKNLIDDLRSIL